MLGEGFTAGGGVVHRIHLLVPLAVERGGPLAEHSTVGGEFFVLEIFADLGQPIEILGLAGIFFDDQSPFALGKFLAAAFGFGPLGRGFAGLLIPLAHLQNRVILQFLLDSLFQGHQRELQNLHALDHPRRQELPHLLAH
jgi:hypothetical protein